jgi:hypothetical protein
LIPGRRYVYLLDGSGRVRWQGSGTPSAEELQLLASLAERLLVERGGV